MTFKPKYATDETEELYEAILSLSTKEECYKFFDDLCTIQEILSISQRWHVARLLNEKQTYAQIEQETNMSTATISRINKCLRHGAGGYTLALEKMNKHEED